MSSSPLDLPTRAAPLLEVDELRVSYPLGDGLWRRRRGEVLAVAGVSLALYPGETFGLVGESGCGKSSLGLALLGWVPSSGGHLTLEGGDLRHPTKALAARRQREIQMVFQDPQAALNPRLTAGESIGEPLLVQGLARGRALRGRVVQLLDQVGLAADAANRYPHQFSGGQRQRVVIARALALQPKILICDEPVSALDLSVQSQILNLLLALQQELGLSYLFISHDLAVVRHISHRIGVMYLGRLVEVGTAEQLFQNPQHPYTQALIEALPRPKPGVRRQWRPIQGELPSPVNPPSGCPFHPRCPLVESRCRREHPGLQGDDQQRAACWVSAPPPQGGAVPPHALHGKK